MVNAPCQVLACLELIISLYDALAHCRLTAGLVGTALTRVRIHVSVFVTSGGGEGRRMVQIEAFRSDRDSTVTAQHHRD